MTLLLPASIVPAMFALAVTLAQATSPPRPVETGAKAQAQSLLREGTALFDRGEAAAALRKFEQAYAVFPSPKIWFDVGAAQRALDRPAEALQAFQRFLDEAPQAPAESRAEAKQAVATLMSALGRLTIVCPVSGADVSIDGKPAGVTPLAGPIWATPGQHQIAARREGMTPDVQDVAVTAGSEGTVTLVLRAAAPAAAPSLAAPVPTERPSPAALVSPAPPVGPSTAASPPAARPPTASPRPWRTTPGSWAVRSTRWASSGPTWWPTTSAAPGA